MSNWDGNGSLLVGKFVTKVTHNECNYEHSTSLANSQSIIDIPAERENCIFDFVRVFCLHCGKLDDVDAAMKKCGPVQQEDFTVVYGGSIKISTRF